MPFVFLAFSVHLFFSFLFLSFHESVPISGFHTVTSVCKLKTVSWPQALSDVLSCPHAIDTVSQRLPSLLTFLDSCSQLWQNTLTSCSLRYSIKHTYLSMCHPSMLYLYLIEVSVSSFCPMPSVSFHIVIFTMLNLPCLKSFSLAFFFLLVFCRNPSQTSFSEKVKTSSK